MAEAQHTTVTIAPPPDEALALPPRLTRANAPLFVSDALLSEIAIRREVHRRLARAAGILITAIEHHPGDAVPRDVLAPLVARLRFHVYRDEPLPPPAP